MKAAARSAVVTIVIALAGGNVQADGKFYEREEVPSRVPYQRAFLVFHDGTETLAVQSKYNRSQSAATHSIGWVVPVPSVPEVASMDPRAASYFFSSAGWRTSAEYWRVSRFFLIPGIAMFLGGLLLMVVSILQVLVRWYWSLDMGRWPNRLLMGICVTVLGFFLFVLAAPTFGIAGDVEVVKAEQVGIYDVKVIKGDDAGPIMAWLTENGFRFGDSDKAVFDGYVSKGWCFVTAKVGSQAGPRSIEAEGMAAPLVLKFRTEKPVYPLALTATAGAKTEVLLYTLSQNKLACGARLPLRHARIGADGLRDVSLITSSSEDRQFFDDLPKTSLILCKFRGILTPDQMKQDLVFEPAADDKPYHETKVVW